LNRIHAVTPDAEFADLVRIDSADHYIQRITTIWGDQLSQQPRDALTRDLLALRERWLNSGDPQILAEPVPKTFSHGDANLINWLWDGVTARCVDFEFAGWSDLAFDCADLVEHISARDIDDEVWAGVMTKLGITGANMHRYLAAQRTCALRWLAVIWKQRHQRQYEFQVQLDRIRQLQRANEAPHNRVR
jgi:thiamine kinase-like enzyme